MNMDEALRLIEESPLNVLTNQELIDYIYEYPNVGANVLSNYSDEKVYGMCKLVGASVYAMLMVNGDTEVAEIDNELIMKICAVAIRATTGLLTLEEIR